MIVLIQSVQATETYIFDTKWGSFGDGNGQFAFPINMAIDSLNNIYVVDCGLGRMHVRGFTCLPDLYYLFCNYRKKGIYSDKMSPPSKKRTESNQSRTHFIGTGYNTSPTPGSGIVAMVVLRLSSGFALICLDDIV